MYCIMDIKSQHIITIWLFWDTSMIPLKNVGQSFPSCQRGFLWHRSATLIRRQHGGQTRPKWNGNGWWNTGIPQRERGNAAETCGKCWKRLKSILKTSRDIGRYWKHVFRLAIFRQKGQSSIIWLEQLHWQVSHKMPQVPIFPPIHVHRLGNSACCLGRARLNDSSYSTYWHLINFHFRSRSSERLPSLSAVSETLALNLQTCQAQKDL